MVIIYIIVLICGIQIFLNKGQKRYNLFICSVLLLSSSIILIEKPHVSAHRFFILAYWISILYHGEYKQILSFPLKTILFVYFICLIVSCIGAQHLTLFYKFYKPFILMVDTFLLLMMGYVNSDKLKLVSKPIIITLYFVSLYGLFTFFFQSDPIRTLINPGFSNTYFWGERLRVGSTWFHPISYGFICCAFSLLVFKEYESKCKWILLFLLLFNALVCGSRTVVVCLASTICVYWLFAYNLKKKIIVGIGAILIVLLFYNIPYISDRINDAYVTATGEEEIGGSSLDMRKMQLEAVLYESRNFIVTGGGLDYAQEVLGLGKEDWNSVKGDLYGMESCIFGILMSRGILGLCVELFLIISLVIFSWKKSPQKDKAYFLSLLSGYYTFGILTGFLGIHIITLFYMGITMRRMINESTLKSSLNWPESR